MEKKWLLRQLREPLRVRHLRIPKPELGESLRVLVEQCHHAELLCEPTQLSQGRGLLGQIHEVRAHSPLREEPQRLAGLSTLPDAEYLDFQNELSRWLRLQMPNREMSQAREVIYSPAWWIPGGHLQTLWGKLFRRQSAAPTTLERWDTPDGDFVELHRLAAPKASPRLILLHGLEGTVRSHYAQGLLGEAARRGWAADLLIFRSCGSEINRARRFYHSGETTDLALVIDRIVAQAPNAKVALAGVSLGGNVLLKFLGERGNDLPPQLVAAAAISVPFDLGRSAQRIRRGFSAVYQRFFLKSLKRKALEKLARYPDLAERGSILGVRTMEDFDNVITAPLHGYRDARDYYERASSLFSLERIRLNTLLLSAVDDPMLPPEVLDEVREAARANPALHIEFVGKGGHAGFVTGSLPWRPFYYAEYRVGEFFASRFQEAASVPLTKQRSR